MVLLTLSSNATGRDASVLWRTVQLASFRKRELKQQTPGGGNESQPAPASASPFQGNAKLLIGLDEPEGAKHRKGSCRQRPPTRQPLFQRDATLGG